MKPRIAFYSHDALGLGHMRRNLALAKRVVAGGRRSALLLTGAREAGALPMPHGIECLTLPALRKGADGSYSSRSLALSLATLLRLRAETLQVALEALEPDVLVVDKHPLGFGGELEPAIAMLRARGGTRLVLGLREILDEPEVTRSEWARAGTEAAIAAYFDRVWIYGDPTVYDPVAEYGLEAIADKVRYTGYLAVDPGAPDTDRATVLEGLGLPLAPLELCVVGGGQDGGALATAFVAAPFPEGTHGALVAGPFMPADVRERLHAAAAARPELTVLDFVKDPRSLYAHAEGIMAMGGYNTVCEVLGAARPALIVPRERPRLEQLMRAEGLAARGVLDLMRADDLSPEALGRWMAASYAKAPPDRGLVDVDGLSRVDELLGEVITGSPRQPQQEAPLVG